MKLSALALAFPRSQQLLTWLPVSGSFMSAFVLAASLSPASPSRLSAAPPSGADNNPGVLCWVSRYRQSGDSLCGGAGSSVVVAR